MLAGAVTNIRITENPSVPGAPTGVIVAAGNHEAVVSFSAPASEGGDSINLYTVTASPGGSLPQPPCGIICWRRLANLSLCEEF